MRARGRYEDRNSILHNWSDYGSWSHACLVTALGETMTAEERARLIKRLEMGCPTKKDCLDAISDLRRLDLLEKALRKIIPLAGNIEPLDACRFIIIEAKLALGDA